MEVVRLYVEVVRSQVGRGSQITCGDSQVICGGSQVTGGWR